MALTAFNALISLKDGANAPVNLAPGVTGSFTPGNDLVFSLQNTWGIQRAEMTINAPRYPSLDKTTWEWRPGQYNGWRITFPENTLVDDTTDLAGIQIVVNVSDGISSNITVSYDLESALASLGLGGTLTGVVDYAAAAGDVLMQSATDANRLSKWVPGFIPVGVAIIAVPIFGLIVYAPEGTLVSASVLGITPPITASWAVVNSSARVVVKKNPDPSDMIAGALSAQASLIVNFRRPVVSDVGGANAPYLLDNTGTLDCSTVLRQMVADAEIPGGELIQNFASKRCFLPKGVYKLDRPVHINVEAQKWYGEGRLLAHIRSVNHVGPTFHIAPDIGNFPVQLNSFIGNTRQALVFKHDVSISNEHWFHFGEDGAVNFNGRSAMCIEMWLKVDNTTGGSTNVLCISYGKRFSDDTAWGYGEGWGLVYAQTGSPRTTKSVGFTLTTATTGIKTFYTPNNSVPDDGSWHLVEASLTGGVVRVFVDGTSQTLTDNLGNVTAPGAATMVGNIVQQSWESQTFGGGFDYFLQQRSSIGADFKMGTFRMSDIARHTTDYGPVTQARFSTDANTVIAILTADKTTDADDLDGVFIRGWARGDMGVNTLYNAYYVHRLDNVAVVGGMVDCSVTDLEITNLFGTALSCNSTFNAVYRDLTILAKNGIRLDNNCFKTSTSNIYLTGSNANLPNGRSAKIGISMSGAANVMSIGNIYVSGFDYNFVVNSAGDVGTWGSWYSTVTKGHIFVDLSVNLTWCAESEISDEASVLVGKPPEFFVGIVATGQTYWAGLQLSHTVAGIPSLIWQGDGSLPNQECRHVFDCFYDYSVAPTAIVKVVGTAPKGFMQFNGSSLQPTIPILTSGSAVGSRVIMKPENEVAFASQAMTDSAFTLPRDVWLRNNYITLTGALTANRVVTIPPALIGRRTVKDGTTGGFTVTLQASGGALTVAIPSTQQVTVICDGTDVRPG